MVYILSKDFPKDWVSPFYEQRWAEYRAYLESLRGQIPAATYAFATANWHYEGYHTLWPHDGRLEALYIRPHAGAPWSRELWEALNAAAAAWDSHAPDPESAAESDAWMAQMNQAPIAWQAPANVAEYPDLRLCLRTDPGALLQLDYLGVRSYRLVAIWGNWRYDEVRRTDAGLVIHEIEWVAGTYWQIECADIQATSNPPEQQGG
jgi:hypothetical protein